MYLELNRQVEQKVNGSVHAMTLVRTVIAPKNRTYNTQFKEEAVWIIECHGNHRPCMLINEAGVARLARKIIGNHQTRYAFITSKQWTVYKPFECAYSDLLRHYEAACKEVLYGIKKDDSANRSPAGVPLNDADYAKLMESVK